MQRRGEEQLGESSSSLKKPRNEVPHSQKLALYGRMYSRETLFASHVLISGMQGLGVEIAKNLILAGVKSVTFHDDRPVELWDLSTSYVFTESDVGKNRALVSAEKLQELNNDVIIDTLTCSLTTDHLSRFQVVVFTDMDLRKAVELNDYCHSHQPPIYFIKAEVRGPFGCIFCDFGPEFTVVDVDGEDPHTGVIESITNDNPALVSCVGDKRLEFRDGDLVVFSGVHGMTELNDEKHRKIKDARQHSFTLEEDTTNMGTYKKGGIVTQVKLPKVLNFRPLREALKDPVGFVSSAFSKFDRAPLLHLAFQVLDTFFWQCGHFPIAGLEADALELIDLARSINEDLEDGSVVDINPELLKHFAFGARAILNPVAAMFGGIVGQEVVKACSGKFHPLFQFYYFDTLESLPIEDLNPIDLRVWNSHYDSQISVFGPQLHKKVEDAKVFMRRLFASNVLVSGMRGLGVEIAKNLILAGVKSVTLHDEGAVECWDLYNIFVFTESDVGKNRALASALKLEELNNDIDISTSTASLTTDHLSNFQAVVFTDVSLEKAIEFNDYCHSHQPPISFIKAEVRGLFGSIFCDFGPEFTVVDVDGEDPHTGIIESISNDNPALVSCVGDKRLEFRDGDLVMFSGVRGMTELNDGKSRKIKDVRQHSFTLEEDTTNMGTYKKGGIVTQVKLPKVLNFKPLREALKDPGDFLLSDFSKFDHPRLLHLAFQALDKFILELGRFPVAGSEEDAQKLISLASRPSNEVLKDPGDLVSRVFSKFDCVPLLHLAFQGLDKFLSKLGRFPGSEQDAQELFSLVGLGSSIKEDLGDGRAEDVNMKLLRHFSFGSRAVLNPMAAMFGGIVGQEVVKAFSGKFHPLFQFFYFDSVESLPADDLYLDDPMMWNSRYDAQISVFGPPLQKKLEDAKISMRSLLASNLLISGMQGLGVVTGEQTVTKDMKISVIYCMRSIPVSVSPNLTIEGLKWLLLQATRVIPNLQKIFFRGKKLLDDRTLSQSMVEDCATLVLAGYPAVHLSGFDTLSYRPMLARMNGNAKIIVMFRDESIRIRISLDTTFQQLMWMLESLTGALECGQRLTFNGCPLFDKNMTLRQRGLDSGSTVSLYTWSMYVAGFDLMRYRLEMAKITHKAYFDGAKLKAIPHQLWEYSSFLKLLNIKCNNIERLPSQIGCLTSLEELYLDNNSLSNDSLQELAPLQRLTVLSAVGNRFTGDLSGLGCLFSLVKLDFSKNSVTSLHHDIMLLKSLQYLIFYENRIEYVPEWIGECTSLVVVNLADNMLRELPDAFANLINLRRLNVQQNYLKSIPEFLERQEDLMVFWDEQKQ